LHNRKGTSFHLQDSEDEETVVTPKTAGCIYNTGVGKEWAVSFSSFAESANASFLDE
jgi:hypothetical protein